MHRAKNLQKLLKSILKKKLDYHACPIGHQLPSLEATTVTKFSCILSDIYIYIYVHTHTQYMFTYKYIFIFTYKYLIYIMYMCVCIYI